MQRETFHESLNEKRKKKKRKKLVSFFVTSQKNEGSRNWIVSARMERVVATVIARNPIATVKTNGGGANRSRASASRDFHPVSHRDSADHAVYPSRASSTTSVAKFTRGRDNEKLDKRGAT